jgi:3-deoxy-D-manno-octulosonic-acid transferase
MLKLYEGFTGSLYRVSRPLLDLWSRFDGKEGMWPGKLGDIPREVIAMGPPDIWLQAVSVGEVAVAEAILNAMDKKGANLKILVSSSTPTGFAMAISSFGKRFPIIPYPLDFPQVVSRVANVLRPRVYACLEAELWPNLIRSVRSLGTKTMLINGRISSRSFPRYMKLRSITSPLLSGFSKICAISETHAERFAAMGAPRENILVTGNAKFEGLLTRPSPERVNAIKKKMNLGPSQRVFVAGSLRKGEEGDMAMVCSRLLESCQDMVIFLVPRHTKRVSLFEKAIKARQISYQLWSSLQVGVPRQARVVLVDVIGPLYDLYGLAHVSFVGGSLVPKGGQNLMEPASWSCPVFYGPYTENFEEARIALEREGGGKEVEGADDLTQELLRVLANPGKREEMGISALSALKSVSKEAASRQADTIPEVLNGH